MGADTVALDLGVDLRVCEHTLRFESCSITSLEHVEILVNKNLVLLSASARYFRKLVGKIDTETPTSSVAVSRR